MAPWLTPRRLLIVSLVLLLASAWSFLSMWAGADLGCMDCDCRFRLWEGPAYCRWPAWWGLAWEVLFVLSAGCASLAWVKVRKARQKP